MRLNRFVNSSCTIKFLHFVVSLQRKFYTLALTSVFDMSIYSSSLRLFEIDPVVSRWLRVILKFV